MSFFSTKCYFWRVNKSGELHWKANHRNRIQKNRKIQILSTTSFLIQYPEKTRPRGKKQEIISPLVMRKSKYSHIFLRTIFVAFHHHNCWIWFYVYFCLVSPEMSKLLCMRKTKQWICDNYISLLTFCWNVLTLFFTQFSTLLA